MVSGFPLSQTPLNLGARGTILSDTERAEVLLINVPHYNVCSLGRVSSYFKMSCGSFSVLTSSNETIIVIIM